MKNILSSLNESEKKRILEMHKNTSNRHYLNEGYEKMAQAISKYSGSDYFDMGELSAKGASSAKNPVLHITLKNAAPQNFVKVGAKNNEQYSCKTGWGGPNPFENNIKLEYLPKNYALFKTDAGKTPSSIAQTFVTNVCNEIGFPQKTTSPTPLASTSTTQQGSTANATLTSSDNFQSCPTTGYIEYEYDEKSTKDDVRIILKRNGSYKQGFYSTQGGNKLGTYSCKSKTWYSWGDPTTNMWESDIIIKPSKGGYPDIQADNGKTPQQISEEIINCMCNKAVWK